MAAKLAFETPAKPFGTFELRLQDREGAPADELYKSLLYAPENATGEWRNAPLNDYYWSRGMFNAALDLFFGSYRFVGAWHLYTPNNPKHLLNSFGWVPVSALRGMPQNGSRFCHMTVTIDGKIYDVELPHKKVDGVATVNVTTTWLRAESRPGNNLVLTNAPVDQASGKNFGVIKHAAMEELRSGVAFSIVVTKRTFFGAVNADGTPVKMDGLQSKAKDLAKLLEIAKTDFVAAREAYFLGKRAIAANADEKASNIAFTQANPLAPEQKAELIKTLNVTVKGADGTVSTVPVANLHGFYKVVRLANGQIDEKAIVVPVFNAEKQDATTLVRKNDGKVAFIELKSAFSK